MTDPLKKAKDFIKYSEANKHLPVQEFYDKLYEESPSAKHKDQLTLIDLIMTTRRNLGRKHG